MLIMALRGLFYAWDIKGKFLFDYFLNYHERSTDITIKLGKNKDITHHGSHREDDWEVTLADTNLKSQTGGRLYIASKYLKDG